MDSDASGDYSIVLTDTDFERPVHLLPWSMYSEDLSREGMPRWSVRRRSLHGGKQEGLDVLALDNGRLSLDIIPGRGMNIFRALCDGVRLGWDNPVGQLVNPVWVRPEDRGGLGWLDGFNELVSRCGPDCTGGPAEDEFTDGRGRRRKVLLCLHGSLSNTPATRLWFRCQGRAPFRLTVGGEVRDARMFGPSWLLRTEISTLPGSAEFEIRDEIVNLDDSPAELEVLYHLNFGRPLLEPGASFVAPATRLTATGPRALEGISAWDRFGPPEPGAGEQCYFLQLAGDDSGRCTVALVNRAREAAARVSFCLRELPAFTLWKMPRCESAGYVTGLEPGTDYPNSRAFERRQGRVLTLAPGGVWRGGVTIGLETGAAPVRALCERIAALAPGKPETCPRLDPAMVPTK